jgi:hypothetical protein
MRILIGSSLSISLSGPYIRFFLINYKGGYVKKHFFIWVLIAFGAIWVIRGCTSSFNNKRVTAARDQRITNQTVTITQEAKDGLDLAALAELVKEVKSAKHLEKEINREGGINNLDLNADGKVDFIKVTEFGNKNDAYGFSLTVEPKDGEEQEIATIQIVKGEEKAEIQVRGNEQVYGHNHYYRSHSPLTSFLLWSYLATPHRYYSSPWHYGSYPSYYNSYSTVSHNVYRSRAVSQTQYANTQRVTANDFRKPQSSLRSPNTGKVANTGIRRSLANPTSTQKQFLARSGSKSVRSGGFGKSSSKSSSVRSGGFGRSSSSSSRSTSSRSRSSARTFSRSYGGFGGGGK